MKNIVKILLIGTILFSVSCKEPEKTKNVSSVSENNSITVTSVENIEEKASPFDTLNYLNLEVLLSFQKENFDWLFQNILPYALSDEIKLVRNELFARKGYCFKDIVLFDYFTRQRWYTPKYSSLDSIILTNNEKTLVDTLLKYEKLNKHLTRKSFQKLFLNEYLMKSDSLGWEIEIPLALWTQAIYKNQSKKMLSHRNYMILISEQAMMSSAPWSYENAYSIKLINKPYGYYHFILLYYCGAEGCSCFTDFVYVLDKELNVLDIKEFNGCVDFKKTAENKYEYSISEGGYDEGITEIEKGFYEISKEGKINVTILGN